MKLCSLNDELFLFYLQAARLDKISTRSRSGRASNQSVQFLMRHFCANRHQSVSNMAPVTSLTPFFATCSIINVIYTESHKGNTRDYKSLLWIKGFWENVGLQSLIISITSSLANRNRQEEAARLRIGGFIVVVDDVPFDDDVTDQLLVSSQLVDQMLPSAAKTKGEKLVGETRLSF